MFLDTGPNLWHTLKPLFLDFSFLTTYSFSYFSRIKKWENMEAAVATKIVKSISQRCRWQRQVSEDLHVKASIQNSAHSFELVQ